MIAYNRFFDEAIENFGLATTLMARKMRSPQSFSMWQSRSPSCTPESECFEGARNREKSACEGARNREKSSCEGFRNRDIICAVPQ